MKLTFKEILDLDVLLTGYENDKVKIKGILNERLNIKTKYWLGKFSDKIQKEKATFGKLRDELITKYGTKTEEGGYEIKATIDDKPNPSLFEFQKELEGMINEEIEIKVPQLDLEAFDFESESDYSYLFKYIIEEEE